MIRLGKTSSRAFRLAICLLALGGGSCLGAKTYQPIFGDPMLEPWRWRTFPELSGLGAECVAEGDDGTMWFGTSDGVWSYDGLQWVSHSSTEVQGSGIVTICRGKAGTMYVAGSWGISEFSSGHWTRLWTTFGRGLGEVRKLTTARDGSLWAATSSGVLHRQKSGWTLYTDAEVANQLRTNASDSQVTIEVLPESVINKRRTNALATVRHDLAEICADRAGRIWLGTAGGEILCFDPSTNETASNAVAIGTAVRWTIYNESDGMVCGRSPSILPLQDGTIWVVYAAGSGQANVFNGLAWRNIDLAAVGMPGDCSYPIQTRDGAIWLSGRYVIGVLRDGTWRTYTKPEVPIPSARNFLLQAADGVLWLGGPSTEIQRVDYQTPRWLTLQGLNFQWESPAGAQWFLQREGRVVVRETNQWTSFGVEDGLMDAPVALVGARNGDVWVAGSHEHTAATARFDGQKWTRFIHDELSWGFDSRAVLAASDGSVWFGAAVDTSGPRRHRAGILQFRDGVWTHHHQPGRAFQNESDANLAALLPATQRPEPIGKFLCLGESRDGRIWAGRNLLVFQDGKKWNHFIPRPEVRIGIIETILTTREQELWIGTRQYGALRYDGRGWQRFQGKQSLVANSVRGLAQTADGSIWAATDRGFSRFDGLSWTANILPVQLDIPHEGGSLRATPSDGIWINRFLPDWNRRAWAKAPSVDTTNCEFWTVCHQFHGRPPETSIIVGAEKVSHPGNLSVFWSGESPWREVKDLPLQFSYRLDGQPWSAFAVEPGHAFFTLPRGRHQLEVRARDRDFNVDPTPATLSFVVLPPVWRQGWFILVMVLLGGAVATQSLRVFLERGRLHRANRVLAAEIEDRKQAEAAVRKSEGLYGSFIAASPDGVAVVDPSGVVSFASRRIYELLGRSPERSIVGTNALNRIAPEDRERALADLATIAKGGVVNSSQSVLVREDGSRLFVEISGAPLLGEDGQPTAIVTMVRDATARRRTEDEIRKLNENLEKRVQARTADLRKASDELKESQRALINLVEDLNDRSLELETANEKLKSLDQLKSLFIASMSHELRTPLNSIIGFSSIILNEWIGPLTGEQKENLAAVLRSGKHLLALINDVIDVTKIEAGKVEVVAEDFDLHDVVTEVVTIVSNDLRGKGLELTVQADPITLHTDRRRLLQCLLNVVSNAVKFTERGAVSIRTGPGRVERTVEITVRDTGIGMSEADLGKLFLPFVRLDTPLRAKVLGTGLGLYLTRKLLTEVLKGEVFVTSAPGQGSQFVLRVPVSIVEGKP